MCEGDIDILMPFFKSSMFHKAITADTHTGQVVSRL